MRAEGVLVVILPKVRDPRFVTIRRGGTLTDSDHQLLALWAASCAEHVLDRFEAAQPEDRRPRQAIEQPGWRLLQACRALPGRPGSEVGPAGEQTAAQSDRVDGESGFGCLLDELHDVGRVGDHREMP